MKVMTQEIKSFPSAPAFREWLASHHGQTDGIWLCRMAPAGLKQVDAAKADGRWSAAYDSPRNATPPEDFLMQLDKNKKAKAFFTTLNKANIYAIVYRLIDIPVPSSKPAVLFTRGTMEMYQ